MKAKNNKSILKRLTADILKQKKLVFCALLGIFIQVGLTVYFPVLIGQAVDAVIAKDVHRILPMIIFKMILVVLFNTLIQWLNPLIYNHLVFIYTQTLRQKIIDKIYRLPISYLDRHSSGDLVSRMTTDVEQLSNGLLMVFNQFFVGLLTIILTIITMAKLDLLMAFLVLALTPLSLFVARFIARKSFSLYQNQTRARGKFTQHIEESLRQESLIQSFNAQEQFIDRFKQLNESYADYSQGAIFYSSTINPATRFINALIYALLAGIGAFRIIAGHFTVGQLTTFLNYVTQYTKPFNDITAVLSELQSALACAERVYLILDEKEAKDSGTKILLSDSVKGSFEFDKISFGYDKNQTLIKNLSMDIPQGSKVAIVGPTGAGKSTLINLLMRFYDLNSGHILLDGQSIKEYTKTSYRRQIGMVLQETWLKTATVLENIAFGYPQASRDQIIAAAKAANANFFIQQLPQGYDTYLADAGESLSQGQRQLLTIARIFVHIPKILILDEATSSIDTRTESLVQEAFEKLMKNRTSFIIAHRLSTIQNADIILVMVDGNIVEHGKHKELMAQKGVYYRMQMTQQA
ncbi:ABC transporter ATP-binding protein [Streptococcus macacae]|uniref:ABC transporter transmembrane region n=1 Tax=Streptococcus macacae NCTC 11558 TaxID=764298 RepID=G5JUC9_9STRE|nr:ABC transporter ATP-binding protein [Streptococcus macacae]EHJ52802.1 ABC transporter transmembrane region [Streptococcus macacae NCTC 11558]SUN78492.1 ABC transporter ATP-binding protein [Streptococcus macacae NCTC 11558]